MQVFERTEKKYVIDEKVFAQFLDEACRYMTPDAYPEAVNHSIYFDSEDYTLIKRSIEKPEYKEKYRLRSYKVPNGQDMVYLEIKKKYLGIVYKRRVGLTWNQFTDYWYDGIKPALTNPVDKQVFAEWDYGRRLYRLEKMTYISYHRLSYVDKENKDFRITFDDELEYMPNKMFTNTSFNIPAPGVIMELKLRDSMPHWMLKLIKKYGIKPVSYSKYGTCYKEMRAGTLKIIPLKLKTA